MPPYIIVRSHSGNMIAYLKAPEQKEKNKQSIRREEIINLKDEIRNITPNKQKTVQGINEMKMSIPKQH